MTKLDTSFISARRVSIPVKVGHVEVGGTADAGEFLKEAGEAGAKFHQGGGGALKGHLRHG